MFLHKSALFSFKFNFVALFLAAPRIEYIEMRKKFYWCLSYRITGIPTANRTWFYNGELLEEDENIQDYAFHSQDGFVTEGKVFVWAFMHL